MFRVGHIINETYRIERLLGQGGTAAVFLVSHVRMPRQFALKVITGAHCSAEFVQRFRQEAEILASIVHPHLVNVVDWNQTPDGKPYLVMEQLVGSDLADFLRRIGPLSPSLALQIFIQVAAALQTAHEHGVVHRDLKPANIFLCNNGPFPYFTKVLDFGIAKSVRLPSALQTDRSVIMGTPAYMAPEQARGDGEQVDERTDQFALATVLYEMIAGRPAFYRVGDHLMETILRVLTAEPEPLHEPRIDAAVRRAMRKQRDQRFPSLAEFIEATGAHELSTAMAVLDRTARVSIRPTPSQPALNPVPPVPPVFPAPLVFPVPSATSAPPVFPVPPLPSAAREIGENPAVSPPSKPEVNLQPPLVAAVTPALEPATQKAAGKLISYDRLRRWCSAAAMVSLLLTGSIPDCGGHSGPEIMDAGAEAGAAPDAAEGDSGSESEADGFVSQEDEGLWEIEDLAVNSPTTPADLAASRPARARTVDLGTVHRGHSPHCCEFSVLGNESIGNEVKEGILACFNRAKPLLSRFHIFKGKVRLGRNRLGLVVVSDWIADPVGMAISSCLEGLKVKHDLLPQTATVSVQESR